MITSAVETACRDHRGAATGVMAEAVVEAYLRAKTKQSDVSSALYLIAVESDARELVEAATRRGEEAIAAMLATASDGHFDAPRVVAQMLLAAVQGTVRTYYERQMPPAIGDEVARQLTLMCRAYLMAARARRAASGSRRKGSI